MQSTHTKVIIALDVGEKRVGVASANALARLPSPLTTLERGESFWDQLQGVLKQEPVETIVVGLPRNLEGNDTAQTMFTRAFIDELRTHTDVPIVTQDEALTSRQAEAELNRRGRKFVKGDIDALAATYILEDFLKNQESRA